MDELVAALLVLSVSSVAVSITLPAVFKATANDCVPLTSAALEGKAALLSVEVISTVSTMPVTTFQLASTALTVRLNEVPAVCAVGEPVLPVVVPGAADSPGANNCSFTNDPGPTATVLETVLLKLPLLKTIVIASATG